METLERPTAERVLHVLPDYHIACYGVSSINPAERHLLLIKEHIPTEEVDKLRIKDIAALKLPGARLAYLSACNTANTTSPKLLDEGTHM